MDLDMIMDDVRFSVRTAAVVRHKDEVLFSKKSDNDYFSFPGGKIKINESSKEALVRELKEELNYDVSESELKLVRIIENFYTKDDIVNHEYLFLYLLDINDDYYNGDFRNLENDNINMEWIKEEAFILMNVVPDTCKGVLHNPSFQHIILKRN